MRAFGVKDTYPDAIQFVTILRDPFEQACSAYFYMLNASARWKDRSRVPQGDLQAWLENSPPNMLNHFPEVVTKQNYRAIVERYFVEIGITEKLPETMSRIAGALARDFVPEQLGFLNETHRDVDGYNLGELRERFRDRYPLEFEVYDHARWLFESRRHGT